MGNESASVRESILRRPVQPDCDHLRGGQARNGAITIVVYGDYLCPYCRRLRLVIARLRETLGEQLAYVFRNFPNEAAHPGATLIARFAEAAGRQGHFWQMYDWLYEQEPPLAEPQIRDFAAALGLDLEQFDRDSRSEEIRRRVEEDLEDGRRNGVTGTPSFFIDGVRYDGAWDFHSMLEACSFPLRPGFSARRGHSPICRPRAGSSCCSRPQRHSSARTARWLPSTGRSSGLISVSVRRGTCCR